MQQWEELAREARVTVESKPLDVNTVWRNPDVAESGGGFKVKKSQMAFPKQLAGIPLSPAAVTGRDTVWMVNLANAKEETHAG